MTYSERLVEAIKEEEGFTEVATHLPGDRPEVITGGFGETHSVTLGQKFTRVGAEARLRARLDGIAAGVRRLVKAPITQGQFDALTDFAYNLGLSALEHSTLLKLLNEGLYSQADDEFVKWNHADGKVLAGLTHRRQIEAQWFNQSA